MPENIALKKKEKGKFDLKNAILERLKWLLFILILGSTSSGLLLGVSYAIPLDEDGLNLEARLLLLRALDVEFTTETVAQVFDENIIIEEVEGLTIYRSLDDSVAFNFTGRGHQGPISGIISLEPNLETIRSVVIVEQQETPGLGGRLTEEEFLDQFKGVLFDPKLNILPSGEEPVADNEVEGITGATMTSNAFETMLNQSIQEVILILEEN